MVLPPNRPGTLTPAAGPSQDYYPNLIELYRTVDVTMTPEDYSSSFRHREHDADPAGSHCFFRCGRAPHRPAYEPQSRVNAPRRRYHNIFVLGWSLSCVSGLRLFSWQFLRLGVNALRFFLYAHLETSTPQGRAAAAALTLGEWLAARGFSADFARLFLLPTMSAVCTCSYDAALNYPADLVLVYLRDKMHVGVRRATNGTADVTRRLAGRVDDMRLGTSIRAVTKDAATGKLRVTTADGAADTFDHVIMATQANTGCAARPSSRPSRLSGDN